MEIPSGIEGTRRTLSIMRELVKAGKVSPLVRQTAVQLTTGLNQKDWLSEVKAIHVFVRDRIRYLRDVRGVETLHTPDRILQNRAGDCDDKTVLLASMLETIGHPTRFVAIGFKPNQCAHVYLEVRPGNKGAWMALETTEAVEVGWSPPKSAIRKTIIAAN